MSMTLTTNFPVGDIPFPEYPRPQLVRPDWTNLNGLWQYAITLSDAFPQTWQGDICVPFCAESTLSGVTKAVLPSETLWYRRNFSIENFDATLDTLLHFGAVDCVCRVFINQTEIGGHTGGYYPFSFDATPYLHDGENEIALAVKDDTNKGHASRGKQSLSPKGIWYTAVTGIWQTVWLEQVPQKHIESLRFTPTLDSITVQPTCTATEDSKVCVEIYDGEKFLYTETFSAVSGSTITLRTPRLWSPENPHLYRIYAHLVCEDIVTDTVESYFSLRTFGVGADENGVQRLLLNGKPYFQKGLLDQGYWPDGLYTAPNEDALWGDIAFAKSLGFNMLRKHGKTEPMRWYYYCDTIGMLVWQDMPNGGAQPNDFMHVLLPNIGISLDDKYHQLFGRSDIAEREGFAIELYEMMTALYNTACVCTWVPFNEGWGQFDAAKTAKFVKSLDATRLVDHASGWFDSGAGDMNSVHCYLKKASLPKPRKAKKDEPFVKDDRVFVLSEYGAYQLREDGHTWSDAKGPGFYHMYTSQQELNEAYQKLHTEQLLPLIAQGLSATIYTQLSDVEAELNGLMTYDRAVCKVDADAVRALNALLVLSDVIAQPLAENKAEIESEFEPAITDLPVLQATENAKIEMVTETAADTDDELDEEDDVAVDKDIDNGIADADADAEVENDSDAETEIEVENDSDAETEIEVEDDSDAETEIDTDDEILLEEDEIAIDGDIAENISESKVEADTDDEIFIEEDEILIEDEIADTDNDVGDTILDYEELNDTDIPDVEPPKKGFFSFFNHLK